MSKLCDHTSVGVVIRDQNGRFALLKRAKFPVGIAPAAGHIDDHGSPEQAAKDEVFEELGLQVNSLIKTAIYGRRVENKCRREDGSYHQWFVYEITVPHTTLKPSTDETKGADWYNAMQLQALADRTEAYHKGKVTEEDWTLNPGLEEVWMPFMQELGHIR